MNRNLHLLLIYLFSLSFFCASSMVILSRDLQVFMGVDVDHDSRLFIISFPCRDNIGSVFMSTDRVFYNRSSTIHGQDEWEVH